MIARLFEKETGLAMGIAMEPTRVLSLATEKTHNLKSCP
jgi:hypothetical protein